MHSPILRSLASTTFSRCYGTTFRRDSSPIQLTEIASSPLIAAAIAQPSAPRGIGWRVKRRVEPRRRITVSIVSVAARACIRRIAVADLDAGDASQLPDELRKIAPHQRLTARDLDQPSFNLLEPIDHRLERRGLTRGQLRSHRRQFRAQQVERIAKLAELVTRDSMIGTGLPLNPNQVKAG